MDLWCGYRILDFGRVLDLKCFFGILGIFGICARKFYINFTW